MDNTVVARLLENYHWGLSLCALAGILAATVLLNLALSLIPTFKAAQQLNKDTFTAKMAKPIYAANQKWNRKWSLVYLAVIFGLVLPFCLTSAPTPLLTRLIDIAVILMFYDFFYYLTHRFLFHQSEFFGGPLVWMHAVHHQQHNPCRNDSSYIHPLEVAIGLGLYVASIFVLSRFMGRFDVLTLVVTWVAFSEINQHNHNLWETDRFPFRYVNYVAKMHHNHHARFTGGNFATITLLYDWMFGTLDKGADLKAKARVKAPVGG